MPGDERWVIAMVKYYRWGRLACVVALGFVGSVSVSAGAAETSASTDVLFAQYAVAEVYHGSVHFPDFKGRDRHFSLFRTVIRNGMRGGANYAGHYALISWGCGTECATYVVGDVTTGKMVELPIGGEEYSRLFIHARSTSRLIIARWTSYTGKFSKDNIPITNCMGQNFVWSGSTIDPLGKPAIIKANNSEDIDTECE